MKKSNQIMSAAMASVISAGSAALCAASLSGITASASDTSQYSNTQFAMNWNALINEEKAKFPETDQGHQTYWNGYGGEDTFTTTPCAHGWDGGSSFCHFIVPPNNIYSSSTYSILDERDAHNCALTYGQCAGFALKLQGDIFQTGVMIRYNLNDEGKAEVVGGKMISMYPKQGDVVRFGGHSIFITNVSRGNVTFAQCNADSHCAIDWDATSYKGVTITADYLLQHASYIERPALCGDLNLDGTITAEDAEIFRTTVMADGETMDYTPLAAYDINFDAMVDEKDYDMMTHMSASAGENLRYVTTRLRTTNCRWRIYGEKYGDFMIADGGIYSTRYNTTGGVTFFGHYDSKKTAYSIPSSVTDPHNGQTYTVTEIGMFANRGPATGLMQTLQTLVIPQTVKKINPYAFYYCDLKTLRFSGLPQIEEIGMYAFSGSKLTQVDARNLTNLKTIGEHAFWKSQNLTTVVLPYSVQNVGVSAFEECTKLTSFSANYDSDYNCELRYVGDNAFKGCKKLAEVVIPNNLHYSIRLGESTGIFDPAVSNVQLRLPNTHNVTGIVWIRTGDDSLWNSGKLNLFAGKYVINYEDGSVRKTSTSLVRVNHP